jgi:hypothetical protein
MVSTKKIHELADQLQKTIKSVRRIPVEYIERAISMVDDEGVINLEQAAAIEVRPLVEARLAEARESFDKNHESIHHEVGAMFRKFSRGTGTRRSKVDAVYSA